MSTKIALYISILILLAMLFNSCGTTHHFVPPRPLENKEYLISVNWHYNFDNSIKNLIIPELSYYTGVDDKNTIGAGYQFPFFISHLSYARYNKVEDDVYWNMFTHINQPFGMNNNPYFEIGASYASKEKHFWQMISTGIAIGDGDRMPLAIYLTSDYSDNYGSGNKLSLIPFFKYQIGGNDIAFSYLHYHGLTKVSLKGILKTIQHKNETLIEIKNNMIDKIEKLPENLFHPSGIYGIFLHNGDTLILKSPYRGVDQMSHNAASNNYLSQKGYIDFSIAIHKPSAQEYLGTSTLKISDLVKAFNNGEDLILTRYSVEVLDEINNLKNFNVDHSIGVSLQNYKFRK